jgi:hypothetical protein
VHAVRDGHYESLFELSASGPLGVVVDRGRTEAPQMSAGLAAAGFTHGASDDRWDSFVVPEHAAITARLGRAVPIASARASMHGEDVGRMLDGELTTAWGTGVNQVGGEDVVLDVGSPQLVGAVVLEMGAFSFGHPRALQVDVSTDGRAWTPAWHGDTSVETVRGAIQQPGRVPIALEFAPASARLIRLTQQGNEPGIPWWIAEVRVYGP